MRILAFLFGSGLALLAIIHAPAARSQAMPSLPPLTGEEDDLSSSKSFMDLLRRDLMQRIEDARKQNQAGQAGSTSHRVTRPEPELGQRPSAQSDPVDLSKYIGPDGNPQKTLDKLIEKGVIPKPASLNIPQPTKSLDKQWDGVEIGKRLKYAEDLVERRKPQTALEELGAILDSGELNEDQKLKALTLHEKALLLSREYKQVQEDYYRLKAYYPNSDEVNRLKDYYEEETGLTPLQDAVKKDPANVEAHRALLEKYFQLGWLDFAEQFFGDEMRDTSVATFKSLSDIYYRKKELDMLIQLSQAGKTLHPDTPDFFYNEGVALYAKGDALSRKAAREQFMQAKQISRDPALNVKINWYLQHLPVTR
ncbi:MAG: hypothetical protein GC154_16045 [bacterium]|nr:hypothetical protein [bacterium]